MPLFRLDKIYFLWKTPRHHELYLYRRQSEGHDECSQNGRYLQVHQFATDKAITGAKSALVL